MFIKGKIECLLCHNKAVSIVVEVGISPYPACQNHNSTGIAHPIETIQYYDCDSLVFVPKVSTPTNRG